MRGVGVENQFCPQPGYLVWRGAAPGFYAAVLKGLQLHPSRPRT